jgi:hypothetical protein
MPAQRLPFHSFFLSGALAGPIWDGVSYEIGCDLMNNRNNNSNGNTTGRSVIGGMLAGTIISLPMWCLSRFLPDRYSANALRLATLGAPYVFTVIGDAVANAISVPDCKHMDENNSCIEWDSNFLSNHAKSEMMGSLVLQGGFLTLYCAYQFVKSNYRPADNPAINAAPIVATPTLEQRYAASGYRGEGEVEADFKDPISLELMDDPIIPSSCPHNFDRKNIGAAKQHGCCVICRKPFKLERLDNAPTNTYLKNKIISFVEKIEAEKILCDLHESKAQENINEYVNLGPEGQPEQLDQDVSITIHAAALPSQNPASLANSPASLFNRNNQLQDIQNNLSEPLLSTARGPGNSN